MKSLLLLGFAASIALVNSPSASAMWIPKQSVGIAQMDHDIVQIHGHHGGRGHHYGWGRGRGHHYGWSRGRHRGW
jgi:hypothetical protein